MTRILIADPDPRIRQALVLLLERRLDAIQASEAWDRASLECQLALLRPDALLLDCHLPGLATADIAALRRRPVYWYHPSYEEIAAATATTVSAVTSRLHRARCALAPLVKPTENVPPGTTRSLRRPALARSCPAI